jgi:thiamine pyrophosphate-dependent acetolactate synthase large subunit-like protein
VAPGNDHSLKRREVVAALLAERGDALVVAGLGAPVWARAAAGDHPLNFYLWGAMGSAVPIGLGLALARPERRVLTVTGDGELLMGLGSLATAAVQAPPNLAIVVLDNERYGETGMQRTHTALGVDLAAVAAAAGMPVTRSVADEAGLEEAVALAHAAAGPVFLNIKVSDEKAPLVLPIRDGVELKNRFRRALLGDEAFA